MRHACAMMHVRIANPRGWLGKCSRHSRCMRNPQFYVSGKRQMNLTLKRSHSGSNFLSTRISFYVKSTLSFLRYGYFKIWPWKFKVEARLEVKGQGHTVGLASIWWPSILFHANRPVIDKIWMTNRMFDPMSPIRPANIYHVKSK